MNKLTFIPLGIIVFLFFLKFIAFLINLHSDLGILGLGLILTIIVSFVIYMFNKGTNNEEV